MSRTALARAVECRQCLACRHFANAPEAMERLFPGLTSFSSGHASVRADDGLCAHHDQLVSAGDGCRQFEAG